MDAYGATYQAQVVGGPDWLNKGLQHQRQVPRRPRSRIPEDDLRRPPRPGPRHEQSLLADRFHLKAHFETRVLPVYELVPAKGGLKITELPAPPERKPGDPPFPSVSTSATRPLPAR